MAHGRSLAAEEFLSLRHKLADDANTSMLEELHNELASMVASDPDRAVSILQALADSGDKADRDTAAIYVSALFATRAGQAREILLALISDEDRDVRRQALDTLDIATGDKQFTATQAARLATNPQN